MSDSCDDVNMGLMGVGGGATLSEANSSDPQVVKSYLSDEDNQVATFTHPSWSGGQVVITRKSSNR